MLELMLNEILVQPIDAVDTTLLLESSLYNIESTNTIEARVQSVSTDNGNEHTVTKLSNESLIATKVASGRLALMNPGPANEEQCLDVLAVVFLK